MRRVFEVEDVLDKVISSKLKAKNIDFSIRVLEVSEAIRDYSDCQITRDDLKSIIQKNLEAMETIDVQIKILENAYLAITGLPIYEIEDV